MGGELAARPLALPLLRRSLTGMMTSNRAWCLRQRLYSTGFEEGEFSKFVPTEFSEIVD
jgi:hypothetical protein